MAEVAPPAGPVMKCPKCGHSNPAGTYLCASCSAPMSEETVMMTELTPSAGDATVMMTDLMPSAGDATVMMPELTSQDRSSSPPSGPGAAGQELEPGTVLGDRYEILEMLGIGGMGAVYKAKDLELDRLVALKVIRPDLANNPSIIERFKQELILARQVTHKNVIRVFDLGVAGGIKFITMEFIEGRTLAAVMSERKFTPEESTRVIQQMCRALEAAHAEGVVHRDLKPQNVMVDAQGKASVMDFGLALSSGVPGGPKAGGLGGTPAYMSPEQVTSAEVDHRSDIFTLGVIYYELLLGRLPFQADSVIRSLRMRTEQPAKPAAEVDPRIPKAISDIVAKCMAIDPAARFQSASELLHQLDIVTGDYKPVTPFWKWTAAGAGVLLVAVLAVVAIFGNRIFKPPPPKKAVTVLVADFRNNTGEPVFDRTLEPVLKIALEGAGFVNAYDRTQLRSLGVPAAEKLDEQAARQIAVSQGLGAVVSGTLERRGGGYRLSVRAIQAVTGNPIASTGVNASNRDQVMSAVTRVAAAVRKGLGDDTSESAQRFAMETISATSLEAVHDYAEGMNHLSSGKFDAALASMSAAVGRDPNFGLAYAVMASASRNLGRPQDAEKYINLAVANIGRMTERERFRTRGFLYLLKSDLQKCVEEYGALIAKYSSDVAAHNNLAYCAADLRNIPKAVQETRQAAEILPKRALYRGNLAMYLAYGGEFQAAEKEARAALQLDPSAVPGLIGLAYSQVGQGQLSQAAETYQKLEKVGAFSSVAASGLADLALYEGRFSDAVRILEGGVAADVASKNLGRAADKLVALAYTRILQGQKAAARAAAERALANSKSPKTAFLAARSFVEADQAARARELASSLASELQTEPQVYAKLIEGEIALKAGDARQAIGLITEANKQLDTWIGRFDLGRAYLGAGAFIEADSEFDRCLKRRGEAVALFLNEVPSYGYLPPVYYYMGRVREGLKSTGFAELYRTYMNIRGKAGEDPLLAEVRRRANE